MVGMFPRAHKLDEFALRTALGLPNLVELVPRMHKIDAKRRDQAADRANLVTVVPHTHRPTRTSLSRRSSTANHVAVVLRGTHRQSPEAVVEAGDGGYCLIERARRAAKGGIAVSFSKLGYFEKVAAVAAVVVVITALISLANDWGILMAISLLAGLGALIVIFLPQTAPTTALPGSKGSLLVATGAVATVVTAVVALTWIGWIGEHLATFDTLQFLLGLVAAVVLAWAGWQVLRAEGGKLQFGAAAPVAAAAPTMPPSEPAMTSTEPTMPPSEATMAPAEPTMPSIESTMPPSEPTMQSSEPTMAPSEPTEPPSEPMPPS
jgi:hypothetical protein